MATPENTLAFDGGWEYAPAPESTDHVKVAKKYDLFIGGEFVRPESGRYFATVNPATEERLSRVALANDADVPLQTLDFGRMAPNCVHRGLQLLL